MLCSWRICPSTVSRRGHDLHCARPRANSTKNFMFLIRHSMRQASRMKLQFLPEHLYRYIYIYIERLTGVVTSKYMYEWIHFYHSILIMIQGYVYKYVRFLFSHNLPNALCYTLLI